jgi:hypothetical protein
VNAEIGIVRAGRAVLLLNAVTSGEHSLLQHFKSFLPVRQSEDTSDVWLIVGDRLPGSGKGG